jgi:hypothetical protein
MGSTGTEAGEEPVWSIRLGSLHYQQQTGRGPRTVILFFMHVRYSPWLIWIVAGGSLLWLGILISYSVTDYLTHEWIHVPGH